MTSTPQSNADRNGSSGKATRCVPRVLWYAIIAVLILEGAILLPHSIAHHRHLYGDGAAMLLSVVRTQSPVSWQPCRSFHHALSQAPAALLLDILPTRIRSASWVYGFTLFYLPFLCIVLATCLLLREQRGIAAALVVSAHTLTNLFALMFVVSESHLCAALFLLQAVLLLTTTPSPRTRLWGLILLGVFSSRVYESNAIFASMLLVELWLLRKNLVIDRTTCYLAVILAVVYGLSVVYGVHAIMTTQVTENRAGLAVSVLQNRWNLMPPLLLGGVLACFIWRSPPSWLAPLSLSGGVVLAVLVLSGSIPPLPSPEQAYLLRSWNLFIPAAVAVALVFMRGRSLKPPEPTLPAALVLSLALVTTAVQVQHTRNWEDFLQSFRHELRQRTGYVDYRTVPLQQTNYGWFWTYPTMSILLQAFEQRPVTCVLENRHTPFQPYGSHAPPRPATFHHTAIRIAPDLWPAGEQE